jgi:hypothetical protein
MNEIDHAEEYMLSLKRLDSIELETLRSFPGKGLIVGPKLASDTEAFLAHAKRLIAAGVPQMSVYTIEHNFQHWISEKHAIYPCWIIEGVPSKEGKLLSSEWMLAHVPDWKGSTRTLRHTVELALKSGETIPKFGLKIQLLIFKRTLINQFSSKPLNRDSGMRTLTVGGINVRPPTDHHENG